MKTNLIEITVSGRTGEGKSEVLEVITNALRDFYNIHEGSRIKIAGKNVKGAINEARVTNQTANKKETVFVLYEQNVSGDVKIYD
jgi:predicted ATP-binding protein involved in virulence